MSDNELLAAIESGEVTSAQLPEIFAKDGPIDEVGRLKSLASLLRREPQKAGPYFSRLDPQKLAQAIEDNRLSPQLISLAVRAFPEDERLTASALGHPRTPTPAMLLLAERVSGATLATLLRDELRLILSPELARALARNRHLDEQQWDQIESLLKRLEEDENLRIRPEMRPESFATEDRNLLLEEREKESPLPSEEQPKRRETIYGRLMRMTPAEKALLAINGNRDVRMLLARDPNQMISRAVLRSPRLNEIDVAMIAQMRDVDEEVLRLISMSRRWTRQYQIMKNLALNPRTPVAIALSLMERLNNQDVRLASRDHNLSDPVRNAAKRLARRRGLH